MNLPWYMGRNDQWPAKLAAAPPAIRAYLDEFLEQGVVVLKGAVASDLCDHMRSEFDAFSARHGSIFYPHRDEHGHYPRIINLQVLLPDLMDLFARNSLTTELCDYLFEAETVVYTTLYYERGSAQDIHRDTPYFSTKPAYRYFGAWVALEDTDLGNGPLQVIKGGHLLPELDVERIGHKFFPGLENINPGSPELWAAYQDEMQLMCAERDLKVETIEVNKGDTIIWHPHLPHGGAPILDLSRTRHSLVMHVVPADTPVYHQHVFFNPSLEVPDRVSSPYVQRGDRRCMAHSHADIGHKQVVGLADLQS